MQHISAPWWFGFDLPPRKFDLAHQLPKFETFEQTAERKASLAELLAHGDADCQQLVRQLRACRKGNRCGLTCCPICARRFRRWLGGAVLTKLTDFGINIDGAQEKGTVISLVPIHLQLPPGQLRKLDLRKERDRLHQQLCRAIPDGQIAITGLDFSLNERGDGRSPAYWSPHWYMYTTATDGAAIKEKLQPWYPTNETTPRPVKSREVNDLFEALSYLWKSAFFRRLSYVAENGRQNTRKCLPIKPDHLRELMLVLSHLTPTDRLVVRGMRRRGGHYE